jgi:hypothetical protein
VVRLRPPRPHGHPTPPSGTGARSVMESSCAVSCCGSEVRTHPAPRRRLTEPGSGAMR